MSNHLAIATVTAALGNIVHASAKSAVPGAGLRFGRPQPPAPALRQANIYLYQALPFAPLRNEDLPQRSGAGQLLRRPVAPVSLHYLMSFYGDDATFEPDRMLGAVIRDINATPMLLATDIADAIAGNAVLSGSDLAVGPARVKFSPLVMSLDEMSRLWSVMIQTPYVLSSAWQAEVVQIDAIADFQPATPVLRRGADDKGPQAAAAMPPAIDELWFGFAGTEARTPLPPSMTAAFAGAVMRISGRRFGGDACQVEIAGKVGSGGIFPAVFQPDGTLLLTIPDDAAAAAALAAGPASLRLIITRNGADERSDVAPFLLAPRITGIAPDPLVAAALNAVKIDCVPHVRPGQTATLRLGVIEIVAEAHPAPAATLTFQVPGNEVADGTLAVLTVDGAASQPVVFDAATGLFGFDDAQRVHVA